MDIFGISEVMLEYHPKTHRIKVSGYNIKGKDITVDINSPSDLRHFIQTRSQQVIDSNTPEFYPFSCAGIRADEQGKFYISGHYPRNKAKRNEVLLGDKNEFTIFAKTIITWLNNLVPDYGRSI